MRLNLDSTILRHMSEGVILLNANGRHVGHNPAAEPWLSACAASEPSLKRLIQEELMGRVELPVRIDLGLTRQSLADLKWLCKNGRREYAVFVVPSSGSMRTGSEVRNQRRSTQPNDLKYSALLGAPIRVELARLRVDLRSALDAACRDSEQHLIEPIKKIQKLLTQLDELAETAGADLALENERIELIPMLQSLIRDLPVGRVREYQLDRGPADVGPVYGVVKWLRYALMALLQSVGRMASPQSKVVISVRQMGDFMVVTCGLSSANFGAHRLTPEILRPEAPAESEVRDNYLAAAIGLHIIELHGGKIRGMAGGKATTSWMQPIDSFTMTLPTGLPPSERSRTNCAHCRHTVQAQAYARDIARLISAEHNL